MNVKELEALVKVQAGEIGNLLEAQANLTSRLDNIVEGFKLQMADVMDLLQGTQGEVNRLRNWIGADDVDGPFNEEFTNLVALLDNLTAKVDGRNRSAATKRNMTDADALRVLSGDLKDMNHKDAAEVIGLTYAQVYSARGEFTFKHVHKVLREEKWVNPWAKP